MRTRLLPAAVAATLTTLLLLTTPAAAQDAPATSTTEGPTTTAPDTSSTTTSSTPEAPATTTTAAPLATVPPAPGTKIVGGSPTSPGQFPFLTALVDRGFSVGDGFRCGATVLSRSWVLTAAHCVVDLETYRPYPASEFDVVTGTNSLLSGGQRLPVQATYVHPGYTGPDNDYDVALLRIGRPTTAPEVGVIGSTAPELALDDPGVTATAVGWGTTSEGSNSLPAVARFVALPIQSDATCRAALPARPDPGAIRGIEYRSASMLCAGPLTGGKDTCSGDSGGPLLVPVTGGWRQVGITSFGDGCARPGKPGVYTRLTAVSGWISTQRRYGPFDANGISFTIKQFTDMDNRNPTSSELISSYAELSGGGAPSALMAQRINAATWQYHAGGVTRLYLGGLGFSPNTKVMTDWVGFLRKGAKLQTVARAFANNYSALDNDAFVDKIFTMALGRLPSAGDRAYWSGLIAGGIPRGDVMVRITESGEAKARVAPQVRVFTTWFGLLRQSPSDAVVADRLGQPQAQLIDELRLSYAYANRIQG